MGVRLFSVSIRNFLGRLKIDSFKQVCVFFCYQENTKNEWTRVVGSGPGLAHSPGPAQKEAPTQNFLYLPNSLNKQEIFFVEKVW